MGCFPYTCLYCGGAYKRCAVDHRTESDDGVCDSDDDELIAAVAADKAELDVNGHCKGGQFCWEDDVVAMGPFYVYSGGDSNVCLPERMDFNLNDALIKKGAALAVRGEYEGYGRIDACVPSEAGLGTVTNVAISTFQFLVYFRTWYPKASEKETLVIAASAFACKSCFDTHSRRLASDLVVMNTDTFVEYLANTWRMQ